MLAQSRQARPVLATPAEALERALVTNANTSGGWGYYAGKSSRLEPTCWSLLALAPPSIAPAHATFLTRAQQASGWIVEDAALPVNIGFNALAAFTWLSRPNLESSPAIERLLAALVSSKGVQAPQIEASAQNNSLQGWSWVDATFSWVEPTAWGLLALKRARRDGLASAAAEARIAEAERLLVDRVCRGGGWNYGNASMMHQDLRAYTPTTALSLLALQGRDADAAVSSSLAYLEAHWADEVSAVAMGLALICLDVYGRPVSHIAARLAAYVPEAVAFGNTQGLAVALLALSVSERTHVFRL